MTTTALLVTGAAAGLVMGYVLQRSQLCFHATWAGLYEHRHGLLRAWALGVAILTVGLTAIYATGWWSLSQSLDLRPVGDVLGGLLVGVGMNVAYTCASGLFYKLGAGMLGAGVGLVGWAIGELVGNEVRTGIPGYDWGVRRGFDEATIPGVLGVDRWVAAVPIALVVVVIVVGTARDDRRPATPWQWWWLPAGIGLGVAGVVSWVSAGVAPDQQRFGASTVGAVRSIAEGTPQWWLIAFLVAIVLGAHVAARRSGALWVRGEASATRYTGLVVGGFLLGAGGIIGGGCNLGHGLSGAAQLNLGSWLAVASMIAGIGVARSVRVALSTPVPTPVELA